MDMITQIARAVLYEGYLLWPYRRSALKNRQRWTFGGVYPQAYSHARGGDDPWRMRSECLLEPSSDAATAAAVRIEVRFLHTVRRQPVRLVADRCVPVDELVVDGERKLAWDEARERLISLPELPLAGLDGAFRQSLEIPGGRETEWLTEASGRRVGAVVREWEPLQGEVEVTAEPVGERLFRITLVLGNTTPWTGGSREDALRQTFCSAHAVLRASGADFVSLTDPPEEYRWAASECRNSGVWPVLVGEEGERHTVLSSPIILPDYPRVAPESPGDLFDGGEIDQLLILNVLSLTAAEREEMRATDPKAREILERCASLSAEQLARLHGAIRELRPMAAP